MYIINDFNSFSMSISTNINVNINFEFIIDNYKILSTHNSSNINAIIS
jgi:hypothetical protein